MMSEEKPEGLAQGYSSENSEPSRGDTRCPHRANSVIARRYQIFPVTPTMPSGTTLVRRTVPQWAKPPLLLPRASSIKVPSPATFWCGHQFSHSIP